MHYRVIDANALGYAQYFIGQKKPPEDRRLYVVRGFLEHIRSRLYFDKGIFNVIVWDGRAQWRYDLLPQYKSSRQKTEEQRIARDEYSAQKPLVFEALKHFPVLQLLHPGAEADDVAFGVARQLSAQGHLVTLSTSDTDWLSIVNARTRWSNAKKTSEVIELDGFSKATGFASPQQYAQAKAIAGDSTDDIDGVPGVALKRAGALLAKYGSLSQVLLAAEDFLNFSQEPKYYQPLCNPEVRATVLRNQKLIDLSRGPALDGAQAQQELGTPDEVALGLFFHELGFTDYLSSWHLWERAQHREYPNADIQSALRAVAAMSKSWAVG